MHSSMRFRCGLSASRGVAIFWLLFLLGSLRPALAGDERFTVEAPANVLAGIPFKLQIHPTTRYYQEQDDFPMLYRVVNLQTNKVLVEDRHFLDANNPRPLVVSGILAAQSGGLQLRITLGGHSEEVAVRVLPGWLSLLPPLLAITLALITRQVIIALLAGIWLGAFFLYDYNPFIAYLRMLDSFILKAVANDEHAYILLFSLILGGMVGVMSRAGGTQGIVDALSRHVGDDPRRGQFFTWLMGLLIFFDDYANTLIVGNTMRPLTDRLRISREKLSYLVDSTAAPVATVAIISTWIGYEISLMNEQFASLGITANPYITFIEMIPYSFYPLYTLLFGLTICLSMRDFGPMWHAERRARTTGQLMRPGGVPLANLADDGMLAGEHTAKRWYNALIPIATVIVAVMAGLFYTGWTDGWQQIAAIAREEGIRDGEVGFIRKLSAIIGASNSFSVLLWSAFTGSMVAITLAVSQKLLSLQEALDSWFKGITAMMMACLILTAAWSIGEVCKQLYTADYVVELTRSFLTPAMLPTLMFLGAGMIAFATGTSWGTMAILMPIAIPLAHKAPQLVEGGLDAAHASAILLATIASVLAGATFGDHCSPISDTTIMSSMACNADHIDHVRTQLPYALTVGVISCLLGYIPVGLGLSVWLVLPAGFAAIVATVYFGGRPIDFDKKWK